MKHDKDDLGTRMKIYEAAETERCLMPGLPIMIRLDGKSFSNFTRGLEKPYDTRLMAAMIKTTTFLVEELHAVIGYTQSDEISLILDTHEPIFRGRVQKLVSVVASMCTEAFARFKHTHLSTKLGHPAYFDCRVWNVPSQEEAVNCLVWRELDATKNAIASAAHAKIPHKALQGKNGSQMQEMLFALHGINFNDYPANFKRGTYVRSMRIEQPLASTENLPEKHHARQNPNLTLVHTQVAVLELPQLSKIANKVGVIFAGETPIMKGDL
jgi:tRNA(His) guanylyltransferase